MVALALVALRLRDVPRERPTGSWTTSPGAVLTERQALPVLLVTTCWFLATFGSFLYLTQFVHVRFGVPAEQASLLLIVLGIMGTIATRVSEPLMLAIGARRTMLTAISLFIGVALVIPGGPDPAHRRDPVRHLGVRHLARGAGEPDDHGRVAGHRPWHAALVQLERDEPRAFVISPLLIGKLIEAGGFDLSFRVAAVIGVVALVLGYVILPRTRSVPTQEAIA